MADQTVIGLTKAKINGIYQVDVRNARWSAKRAAPQHVTAGGVKMAIGVELPSGSFDEVIPRSKAFNWRAIKDFTIEIFDAETRSIVLAAFEGCNWNDISGTSDLAQASTSKAIGWAGTGVIQI